MIGNPLVLDEIRKDPGRVLCATAGASVLDLDDGVLCLEFHSKGNTLDGDTLTAAEAANAAIPGRYAALVVANQGKHFSYGANLRWLLSLLDEVAGDRARFRVAAKRFQRITTGMRTAPFPTVSAPFGLTVGGALELTMYADAVQARADMRAGLPELAVGILPDLGGTSELYARCVDAHGNGNEMHALIEAFETIAFMKFSSDAESARGLRFLRAQDAITADGDRLVADAKARALGLAQTYTAPQHRRAIRLLGDEGYAAIDARVESLAGAGRLTEYDGRIARAIGRVMTGSPGQARMATHEELLDAETDWFESLVFEPQTRARMEHMLEHGTPLRN